MLEFVGESVLGPPIIVIILVNSVIKRSIILNNRLILKAFLYHLVDETMIMAGFPLVPPKIASL